MTKLTISLLVLMPVSVAVCLWVANRKVGVSQIRSFPREAISSRSNVRFGKSAHLEGTAIGVGDILFAPAVIDLEGNVFALTNPFSNVSRKCSVSTALKSALDRGCDAVWVKGRLMRAFSIKFTPAGNGSEKSFVDLAFAALLKQKDGTFDVIPFFCTDYYGDSKLMFSQPSPPDELKLRIASEFWGLLLNDQAALMDYADMMYHPGVGRTFRFGIKDGDLYIDKDWNELAKRPE